MQQPTSRAGPQGNASALDPTTRRMLASILATEEEHADDLVGLMRGLRRMSGITPEPGTDPSPQEPGREVPNPVVPPDMEPVVPQQDPPMPGRPGDGEPPPIIASRGRG